MDFWRLTVLLKEIDGHSELLEDALINLVEKGVLVIPDALLRRWTNTIRIRPSMWKYISELFDAVIAREGEDKHGYKLYVGEGNGNWSFLIWDRGEKEELPDDRWWQPIEKLMENKKRSRTDKSE